MLGKQLKIMARAATNINVAPHLSMICKLIDNDLRPRGLGKLSKSYLSGAVSSEIFLMLDFSPKMGTNLCQILWFMQASQQ